MGRKKDAIQPDAGNHDDDLSTPHLNPRNEAMERIAATHEQGVDDELRANGLLDEVHADDTVRTETAPAPAATQPSAEPAKTYKVKIDGVEQEVSDQDPLFNEILREYQKQRTGSMRLEEAAVRNKQLDDREAKLKEREATIEEQLKKQTAVTEEPGKAAITPDISEDKIQEYFDAIYEGDTGKAKDIFKELLAVGRGPATHQPSVDLDEIAARAAKSAKAEVKAELKVEEAIDKFSVDFNDIVSNPQLAKIADGFLDEEIKNGKPFEAALTEAGNRTRKWLEGIAPKPEPIKRDEVLKKKETIDNIQSVSSVTSSTGEDREESTSDVIANMRKSRGLPA